MDLYSNGRPDSGQSGYTLLELVVVLMIISLFSVAALPRLTPQLGSAKLRAGYTHVSSMVNLARFKAVETGALQKLAFDLDTCRIQVTNMAADRVYVSKSLPKGVRFDWVKQKGSSLRKGQARMLFRPDGTTEQTQVKFVCAVDSMTIDINGADSRVRVQ